MKKIILVVLAIFIASNVNAELVDNGNGTITDVDRGLMYYDYTYYADDWSDADSWASNLTYAGYDDWKLPSALNSDGSGPCFGFNCTDSDLGHLYYTEGVTFANPEPFQNIVEGEWYWTETILDTDPDQAWILIFQTPGGAAQGHQHTHYLIEPGVAMAVRVVPEPISSMLFVTGGTLLAGRRLIKRKKKA